MLLGYGFCVPQNLWDRFALAFKPPPPSIQDKLRQTHPELFDSNGWVSSAGTFYLPGPKYLAQRYQHHPFSFWNTLPPTLIELLFHIVTRERGKDVSLVSLKQYLISNGACSDIYAISRQLLEQLQPMLARIMLSRHDHIHEPTNKFQVNAQMYRDGQIRILESVIGELKAFVHSIRPVPNYLQSPSRTGACSLLLTLPETLAIWAQAFPSAHQSFLLGVQRSANTSDVHTLQQAGWEEDIWVLWMCWLLVMDKRGDIKITETEGHVDETDTKALVGGWMNWLRGSYLSGILERVRSGALSSDDPRTRFEALRDVDLGNERDMAETALSDLQDHLHDLIGIVRTAAASAPDSLWGDTMWSEDLIAVWGLRITKYECVEMSLFQDGSGGSDSEEGLVMYLHRMDGRHVWLEEDSEL